MENDIQLPEPFMGRIIIKILKDSFDSFKKKQAKLYDDSFLSQSGFEIADGAVDYVTGEFKIKDKQSLDELVPYQKGEIIKLSEDAFGENFKRYYGSDRTMRPELGDTVLFIRNQQYNLDPAGEYGILNDEHVIAFYKGDKND